ncbi:MAG TPA: trypsin-like peptidase domain-containing protein [Tepidiformaceae bacterium]|nr:trypsin-like peptidase domain-containing protein [Tepidiformaceae bacterium]
MTALLDRIGGQDLAQAAGEVSEHLRQVLVAVRSRAGGGSGTVWREDGLIVTNNHVVPGERAEVQLADDGVYPAKLIARQPEHDLALLKIETAGLRPAVPGDSGAVRPGQLVFAAGNPWGQRGYVTAGVIVSTGQATIENGVPLEEAVRADVRLAPGNSGGPLADAAGRVIGINAMIAGGMAIAVPTHIVTKFLAGELPGRGFLGISGRAIPLPPAVAASFHADDGAGVIVTEVIEESPAAAAGLLPGDVIVRMDGRRGGARALAQGLERLRAGRPVRLDVLRGGSIVQVEASPVEHN